MSRLVYAAVGVSLLETLVSQPNQADLIYEVAVLVITAALTWAVARHAQRWAAWILIALTALTVLVLGAIVPVTGPTSLRDVFFHSPPTTIQMVLNAVTAILLVTAFYFYFSGEREKA